MSNKLNVTKKDIVTMITVAVALALVVIVFVIIYTGGNDNDLDSHAGDTTVHLYSQTGVDGSIEFYTMIEEYTDSGNHASVSYSRKTTTAPSTTEGKSTTTKPVTSVVYVTDESGERVTDESGNPVTEIVTVTTTKKPSTSVVDVTDENGEKVTDENGKPVTDVVTVTSTSNSTTENIWTEESTTNRFGIETEYSNESGTASTLVSEINKKRNENGLSTLKNDGTLSAAARTYSLASAMPDQFSSTGSLGSNVYTFETTGGGGAIYSSILASAADTVSNGEYARIGIGVIKYNGTYYTTVLVV